MSDLSLRQDVPVSAAEVTPHDTDLNEFSLLYVGGAGNVKVATAAGNAVTFTAVPAGQYIPVRTSRVFATGTTATAIVGLG